MASTCLPDQVLQQGNVILVLYRFQADHVLVDPLIEVPIFVQHVGDAAAHTGSEVLARLAQHHHSAAGHVLAAVVAHAFDDSGSAGITDAEPLAGYTADKGLAAGSAVEGNVADDDVLAAVVGNGFGRIDDELAAGQTLSR